jgi:hypothetical protein
LPLQWNAAGVILAAMVKVIFAFFGFLAPQLINAAPRGPDFVVDADLAKSKVSIVTRNFGMKDCAVRDGCVRNAGRRKLLRFFTRIINEGDMDFELGRPSFTNPNFGYSSCRAQYQVKHWANYELLRYENDKPVTVLAGRKQAFCLMDTERVSGAETRKYSCDFQGITAGWADDVEDKLDCQWLDVTGVANGRYVLRITVNPDLVYPEVDFRNNSVEVGVEVY